MSGTKPHGQWAWAKASRTATVLQGTPTKSCSSARGDVNTRSVSASRTSVIVWSRWSCGTAGEFSSAATGMEKSNPKSLTCRCVTTSWTVAGGRASSACGCLCEWSCRSPGACRCAPGCSCWAACFDPCRWGSSPSACACRTAGGVIPLNRTTAVSSNARALRKRRLRTGIPQTTRTAHRIVRPEESTVKLLASSVPSASRDRSGPIPGLPFRITGCGDRTGFIKLMTSVALLMHA